MLPADANVETPRKSNPPVVLLKPAISITPYLGFTPVHPQTQPHLIFPPHPQQFLLYT